MCLITKGRNVGCNNQTGGIRNLYFANFVDEEFDVVAQEVNNLENITAVFKYEVLATTNALTETGTSSRDNGNFLNTQSLAVTLPKLSPQLQEQIQAICMGRPYVFVEDYNGNICLVGERTGTMASCTKATGGAGGDLSGYTLTITAETANLSPFLTANAKADLLALVSAAVVA